MGSLVTPFPCVPVCGRKNSVVLQLVSTVESKITPVKVGQPCSGVLSHSPLIWPYTHTNKNWLDNLNFRIYWRERERNWFYIWISIYFKQHKSPQLKSHPLTPSPHIATVMPVVRHSWPSSATRVGKNQTKPIASATRVGKNKNKLIPVDTV